MYAPAFSLLLVNFVAENRGPIGVTQGSNLTKEALLTLQASSGERGKLISPGGMLVRKDE